MSEFKSLILFLSLSLCAIPSMAALPASVDGQALPSLAPVVERTRPAVVNIATSGKVDVHNNPLMNDPFFKHFFRNFGGGNPMQRETRSAGSGVVIDAENGYIITNSHVIETADQITVTMHDGRQIEAKVVGTDPEADVALLEVIDKDEIELVEIPIADSDGVRVGDFALAIGNPFGLGQTVTSGIISALGRSGLGIERENFIQTDAPINPGNSGGALVNLRGELIGINTAIISSGGSGNVGIGFAIPINMAKQLVDQIIEFGEVRRGMLGVIMQNLTPELSEAFGLDMHQGVVISQVVKESAAEEAGIEAGDVVLSINGEKIKNSASMRNTVGLMRVGEEMDITVIRDGKEKTLTATIKAVGGDTAAGDVLNAKLAGAHIQQEIKDGEQYLIVTSVEPNSSAWNAQLREGDIILSVNRVPVDSIEAFKEVVGKRDSQILLNIQRGRNALFVLIR